MSLDDNNPIFKMPKVLTNDEINDKLPEGWHVRALDDPKEFVVSKAVVFHDQGMRPVIGQVIGYFDVDGDLCNENSKDLKEYFVHEVDRPSETFRIDKNDALFITPDPLTVAGKRSVGIADFRHCLDLIAHTGVEDALMYAMRAALSKSEADMKTAMKMAEAGLQRKIDDTSEELEEVAAVRRAVFGDI